MYWPGSVSVSRVSPIQERSSTSGPPRSSSGCWEVVKSDARTNSVPPQLGQVGSSWAESRETGESHSVQRNVPVPATLPDVQAFMRDSFGALELGQFRGGRTACERGANDSPRQAKSN